MRVTLSSLRLESTSGFVVLEGVNGAGKSTLKHSLSEWLAEQNVSTCLTFEPGATSPGKVLRKLLLEHSAGPLDPLSELFLFAADRREHVCQTIRPALARGDFVLCDRYFYSTAAFQGYGRGLDLSTIETLNLLAVEETLPDLVILLDLDPAEGLARTRSRSKVSPGDSFEAEALPFHQKLRDGFLELAMKRPEPFLVIDASLPPTEVFTQSIQALQAVLKARSY